MRIARTDHQATTAARASSRALAFATTDQSTAVDIAVRAISVAQVSGL